MLQRRLQRRTNRLLRDMLRRGEIESFNRVLAEGPPIEVLLNMLSADFPELIDEAQRLLENDTVPRAQAETAVRALIRAQATWLNSRRSRWTA